LLSVRRSVHVATPSGQARLHRHDLEAPAGLLVLGHGAGGGIDAPDLVIATEVALGLDVSVVLVEQPYRVAGRRSAAPAARLDEAWSAVVGALDPQVPLVTGGRSSGARVACRTAAATGAAGVLCLAFPLHPPGKPEKSRLPELEAVDVPVLVVQGERDAFGMPPPAPGREVAVVKGDHGLKADRAAVGAAIEGFLRQIVQSP
jgi:hypothetical protein